MTIGLSSEQEVEGKDWEEQVEVEKDFWYAVIGLSSVCLYEQLAECHVIHEKDFWYAVIGLSSVCLYEQVEVERDFWYEVIGLSSVCLHEQLAECHVIHVLEGQASQGVAPMDDKW